MDKKHTQRMFLWVLYSLFEFGDNDVMMKVLNPITTIKLNRLHLKSPDCIVLSRTLISPEVIEELDLSSCIAQPEDIRKLEQVLPRCVILRLNQNNLQDSGVIRLFDVLKKSKIKTLALKSNRLTDNCLESAFFALTTNPSLMQLNLSNSSQDEKQANQFSDEKLQYHYERSSQQKEIKWLRMKHFGRSVTELNSLTLITD
ncbi:NACHT, LRR and PYD domains-containing protein 1 homolog [Hemitrygon akajei]|uniref:NACHT, LRR and PYD domains-containing protein 1 homolog n=1 Tax=Hemitrygon akajei TaxID=2704970 RepID=UPI003BF99C2C